MSEENKPRIDLSINLGAILQALVVIGAIFVWWLAGRDSTVQTNTVQDQRLLTHDYKIEQNAKDIADLRRQQKEDEVDVRASLKSFVDTLNDINSRMPRITK